MTQSLAASGIVELGHAFMDAKVLLVAAKLGLFDELADEPLTGREIGERLDDWNLEKKKALIRAAYEALPTGGVFIAVEQLIDDRRRENVFGLLTSLSMLLEFGDAFDFTGAEFRDWCSEAGFRRFSVLPLGSPASAAIAYK